MDVLEFISENVYVLVPVIYVIGIFLKQTPKIFDWCIPWILLAVGIILAVGIMGLSFEAVIQGILATGGAVLTNQLIKQTEKRD